MRLIDGDSVIDKVLKSDKKTYTKSELLKMLGEQKVIIDTEQEKLLTVTSIKKHISPFDFEDLSDEDKSEQSNKVW